MQELLIGQLRVCKPLFSVFSDALFRVCVVLHSLAGICGRDIQIRRLRSSPLSSNLSMKWLGVESCAFIWMSKFDCFDDRCHAEHLRACQSEAPIRRRCSIFPLKSLEAVLKKK